MSVRIGVLRVAVRVNIILLTAYISVVSGVKRVNPRLVDERRHYNLVVYKLRKAASKAHDF